MSIDKPNPTAENLRPNTERNSSSPLPPEEIERIDAERDLSRNEFKSSNQGEQNAFQRGDLYRT